MPIYEYQCQKCGHRMEAIQKVSDKPFTECPECGGGLKKLISSPAFQFKGSGWYVTDYAGKKRDDAKGDGDSKADRTAEAGAAQSGAGKGGQGKSGQSAGGEGGASKSESSAANDG